MSFLSGNQAIVEGAIQVGAKFFAGYPITPASSIMEAWSKQAKKNKSLKFLQSEDELAAIHHGIGSAIAGVPAFTATSGPGFSLMQEGLGLAFAYQAPIVLVNIMRSGPSTGGPTRAGQGEIFASRFGTHGDILPFVFYPTSVQECYDYTIRAFQIAWKYKVPAILLSDAYLASLREKVVTSNQEQVTSNNKIKHYSGLVSRQKNNEKINQIKKNAQNNYKNYNLWGNKKSATLIIATGSLARALRAFEKDYLIYAPIRIWPFLDRDILEIAKNKKEILVIEMNAGQYVREVERVLPREVKFVSFRQETIDLKTLELEIREIL